MKLQKGQIRTVQKYFSASSDAMEILAEAGSDNDKSFLGNFIVKIKRKGVYRFDNGVLVKRIK